MIIMKRFFYSLVLLTFFACTENEDIPTPSDKKVEAEVEPLTLDESFTNIYGDIGANNLSTRVAIDYLRHPIQFNWSKDDIIAVFPLNATFSNGESAQVQFKAYNGVNNNMVNVPNYPSVPFTEFNPGAFGLVNGCEYAAYYPWAGKNNKTNEIEFDYSYLSNGVEEVYGQPVKTTGEKIMERTQVHKHCYMIADAVKPVDDITVFHFEHVGAMVGFHLEFDEKVETNISNTTNGGEKEEITNVKIWLIDGNGKKVKFPGYALGNLNIPNNREHRSDNVSLNSTEKVSESDLDHLYLKIQSGVYRNGNDIMDIMLWLYPQDITGLNFLVIAESKSGQHIQHYGTILKGDKQLKSGVAYAFNPKMHYLDEEMNLATIFKEYNIVNNMNAAAFLDSDNDLYIGHFFMGSGN